MSKQPMFDSPDPSKRHMIGWICDDTKCVWTNPALNGNSSRRSGSRTPIIDRLEGRPATTPSKKRKFRDPDTPASLTDMFGRI